MRHKRDKSRQNKRESRQNKHEIMQKYDKSPYERPPGIEIMQKSLKIIEKMQMKSCKLLDKAF
jgi:hypothetical protein